MSGNKYRPDGRPYKSSRERPQYDFEQERPLVSRGHSIRNLPHFCRNGVMHTCDAKDSTDRQKNCAFHVKCTSATHCMDLKFDEFCGNHILHKYISGGINDSRATVLIGREKERFAEVQNRAEGFHVVFPLDGEETFDNVQHVYDQLCDLGLTTSTFWLDKNGNSCDDHTLFSITEDSIRNGEWCPKRKELKKDILKYFELTRKLKG